MIEISAETILFAGAIAGLISSLKPSGRFIVAAIWLVYLVIKAQWGLA